MVASLAQGLIRVGLGTESTEVGPEPESFGSSLVLGQVWDLGYNYSPGPESAGASQFPRSTRHAWCLDL